MIAKNPPPPVIFEAKDYQIGPKRKVKVLKYVQWPGTRREDLHPGVEQLTFLGYAPLTGILPNGNKFSRPICFSIKAETIFEAVERFEEFRKVAVDDMNKPKIVPPGG